MSESKNEKKKLHQFERFRKKDITKLNFGMVHSQIGFDDGVSIVIRQIAQTMKQYMNISHNNIHYLVGKTVRKNEQTVVEPILWHKEPINEIMLTRFEKGYGGSFNEKIETAINEAKGAIERFVEERKIDAFIVHNSSHPVNFISSIALSRFYRDRIQKGQKTPKYLLWWHDSHLERSRFSNPANDVKEYLMEGVPGQYVEYIIFINSLQFETSAEYFRLLEEVKPGIFEETFENHEVIYNTADDTINSVEELEKAESTELTEKFLKQFRIHSLLKKRNLSLEDVEFCLQHTRIIPRKRIDFAIKYVFEVLEELKRKKQAKGLVFFISGHHGDEQGDYKKDLIKLHKKLSKEHKHNDVMLVFREDYSKATMSFEDLPKVFAKLGGFSTYFSEIEGFGNNLLEVMSGGLIPIVYTYPVFKKDIAKFNFKVIRLDNFEIDKKAIQRTVYMLSNETLKKEWATKNLNILKKKFSHDIISSKLTRAIIRRRTHL